MQNIFVIFCIFFVWITKAKIYKMLKTCKEIILFYFYFCKKKTKAFFLQCSKCHNGVFLSTWPQKKINGTLIFLNILFYQRMAMVLFFFYQRMAKLLCSLHTHKTKLEWFMSPPNTKKHHIIPGSWRRVLPFVLPKLKAARELMGMHALHWYSSLSRGYSQDSMQTRHICTDIFSTLMRVIWVKPVMLFA